MLKPIPASVLKHSATLGICTGSDTWQKPTYRTVALKRILVQPSNETRRTKVNTEVTLRGLCFVDARLSSPKGFDFLVAKDESDAAGDDMTLTFAGSTYTVVVVDKLFDDEGKYHHTELGLM